MTVYRLGVPEVEGLAAARRGDAVVLLPNVPVLRIKSAILTAGDGVSAASIMITVVELSIDFCSSCAPIPMNLDPVRMRLKST